MASDEELLEATKYSMERTGYLSKLRGELNCEIMNVLGVSEIRDLPKPEIPFEMKLVNDLIKEYLTWVGYCYTSCVMTAESNVVEDVPLTRKQMENELGIEVSGGSTDLPLLFCLIDNLLKKKFIPE